MKNQILLSESPDRILFQGRQGYVSLDLTANREGKFQHSTLFNMDSRLLSSENYAFFSPEDAERILSFCRGLPCRAPLYHQDSLQQRIRIARSQWKQKNEQKSTLLFLRKADVQEKTLCTLKAQNDRLMQTKRFDAPSRTVHTEISESI